MTLLVFLLAAIVGGAGAPTVKFALTDFQPITLVLIRALFSAIIIFPFIVKKIKIKKQTFKYLISANILFAINWIFFALGVSRTSVMMAQIMYVPTALIVAIIGYIFLKEKINKEQVYGLLITIIGISFLIENSISDQRVVSFGSPLGNLLIGLGMIAWAGYLVLTRKVSKEYSPGEIIFFNFMVAIPVSLLFIPFEKSPFAISLTLGAIAAISSVVLFSSLGFFLLLQWLVKHTSAFVASLTIYPMTIVATIAGVIFYGEKISLNFLIGAAFILFGVFIATSYKFARNYMKI